jgi:phosphoglycolate phosphatase-like HAD superfamily hydrolase
MSMYFSFVFVICTLTPTHAYTTTQSSGLLSYDLSLNQLGRVIQARALNAEPKYISQVMQKRIDQGNVNAADLRRMFVPTKREVEDLKHSKIAGQVGIILDLEGVLVDLTAVFMLTFTQLAKEFRQEPPTFAAVKDVIGLTLRDSFLAMGWSIKESEMKLAQRRFQDNFNIVLESMPVGLFEGADTSIDAYIADGNSIVISTMLPRDLAVRAISKAGLSASLEGRVEGTCLVYHDTAKDRLAGNQLIRCVAQLQVPLEFTICIASNAKTVLAAKRVGMTVTGIRNNVRDLYALRTADTVVDSLRGFPPRALYDIISKNYINNIGPSPEPAAASDSVRIKSRTLQAPVMEDEVPRDTFADEFGADLL